MNKRHRFEAGIAVGEPPKTIMQGADGEVKPDPPIEIYPSKLHGYWMARWKGHDYALSGFPLEIDGAVVAVWIEEEVGAKVEVQNETR